MQIEEERPLEELGSNDKSLSNPNRFNAEFSTFNSEKELAAFRGTNQTVTTKTKKV